MVQVDLFEELTTEGQKKLRGECSYASVLFKFSGCEIKSEKYFAKVTVRIISPDTGKTLQVSGKQRRAIMERLNDREKQALEAGKQVEKLNAATEVYLPLDDPCDIEERIKDAVTRLYEKYQATLSPMLKQDAEHRHLYSLFLLYQRDFLAGEFIKKKSTHENKRKALEKICANFDDTEIDKITLSALKEYYAGDLKERKKQFALAKKFLEFLRRKNVFSLKNPFEDWEQKLAEKPKTVHPHTAAKRAAKCRKVEFEKEKELYNESFEHIEDPFSLLIPLAMYAHLSIEEIIALKWSDILIEDCENDRMVTIHNIRPDYTGGIHDYSRPPLPACKQLLLKKYDYLSQKYSESSIMKMYLVHQPDKPRKGVSKSKAAKELMDRLKKAKIRFSKVFEIDENGNERDRYSYSGEAATWLLHDHYNSILEEECDVDLFSGLGRFLCGEEIKDSTSSYYIGFTSPNGRYVLEGIVRRDRRFSPVYPISEPHGELTEMGEIVTTVPNRGKDYITEVDVEYVLHPGESLSPEAFYGICGTLRFTNPNDPNAVLPRFEY